MDYWIEHAEIALAEANLPPATAEQLAAIAGVMESAHEFYGQSMGHDVASANLRGEQERQRKAEIAEADRRVKQEREFWENKLKRSKQERERLEWKLHDIRRELTQAMQSA